MTISLHTTKALIPALEVGAALLFIFAYSWLFLEFMRTGWFILSVTFFAIFLIGTVVYQTIRMSERAAILAEGMAENMLTYSHELFKELYQRSPVPYLIIDTKGVITSTNTAALRLFGLEEHDLKEVPFFDFLQSEEEHKIPLLTQYFSQGVSVNEEEVTIKRPDGNVRWVLLSLFPLTNVPDMKGGILTLIDITRQKEVDRAKTEFVSLASHQLRTPLSGMKWHLELFRSAGTESLTPGQADYLNRIEAGVLRMEALVTDFLSVSRLELGTLTPHMEPTDIGGFLSQLVEEHRLNAAARQITLETEWDDGSAFITDPRLLTMSVGNVLSNAIKYTKEGGIVRVRSHTDGKHRVIAVSDTGIGIPVSEHDKIFTKIYRASNAKETVQEGTGLGLYIAREAARIMGGDLTFTSVEGTGTTFTIVLPE